MLIQEMRNRSQGIVAKILVTLIILVFALFGFGQITTFLTPVPKVASINGADITRQEFEIAVERSRQIMIARNIPKADIDEKTLQNEVLRSLINRTTMLQASDDLELYYGEKKQDQDILKNKMFQTDEGLFDADLFKRIISNFGYSALQYKLDMGNDQKIQQLKVALENTSFVTSEEARLSGSLLRQKRDMAYLVLSVDRLAEKTLVSEEETKNYYETHADEFMTEETVSLQYLEVLKSELEKEITITEEDARSYFEAGQEGYTQKERRNYAHILVEVNDDVSKDEAEKKIQDVYLKITEGEDFSQLARTYSDDTLSADKGGDLDFQETGADTFVKEFEEAGAKLSISEVSQPVLTEFGFHLIKLLDVEPAVIPAYKDVSAQVNADMLEAKAEELFLEKSFTLGELAFESPADLQIPSEELGLSIKTTGDIGRTVPQGAESQDSLVANKQVLETAFGTDLIDDGNNSKVIEISADHHVVIRVLEHKPSEQKSLSELKEQIMTLIARERAKDQAKEQAMEIVTMLETGSITKFVADKYDVKWEVVPDLTRTYAGVDSQINNEAFKIPRPGPGGKSVGYTILRNGDVAVISVIKVENVSKDEIEEEYNQRVAMELTPLIGRNDTAALRDYYSGEISIYIKE